MNNADLIKKSDLVLSEIAANGRLSVAQTDRFIRTAIDQPTLLKQTRTVAMNGPEMKINKIGFGSRILRAAVEATPLSQADRSKPTLGMVPLLTKEVIAEVRLPYQVIEDNIERGSITGAPDAGAGGLHQTLVDMMAERAALDLEELAILGDTTSGDPYLALQDGFLKLATANVVAVGGPLTKAAFKAGIRAMPDKYLNNRGQLVHLVSVDNETEMRDQYANRATSLGDANLTGNTALSLFGSKIVPVALMPLATGLFGDPRNLIFGIQRNIFMEYDKDITARVFIIVLTARIAFAIEEVNALVKYTGITNPA